MGDSDHRTKETTKEDDDRIACYNSRHLDKMLDVTVAHVKQLADCHLTENSKSQFVSRFTEFEHIEEKGLVHLVKTAVFKNTIQENVTVNGLPWVINEEFLSTDEKEEQKQETKDAQLSKLSSALQNTAHKRKHIPKQCSRMYSMQLKHERQNLKKANIEHSISLSAASFPNSPYSDRTEELTTILENMMSTKKIRISDYESCAKAVSL
ncbi:uncharacterized protein TNCV_2531972 [Trichonephila clavipes]|nr:uncharacterized protein TNCV_2531972 [Trichonephila clavipes]